jgi:hypothetical protein
MKKSSYLGLLLEELTAGHLLDFIRERWLLSVGNGVCRASKAFGVNCQEANDSYRTNNWTIESHENQFHRT